MRPWAVAHDNDPSADLVLINTERGPETGTVIPDQLRKMLCFFADGDQLARVCRPKRDTGVASVSRVGSIERMIREPLQHAIVIGLAWLHAGERAESPLP